MKKLKQKDKQNRSYIKIDEFKKFALLNITKNSNYQKLVKFKGYNLFHVTPIKSSKIRLINRCLLTNRKKRINNLYSFSRISFLKLAQNNYIYGLKKSVW